MFKSNDVAHKVRVNHLFGTHAADVASHAGTAVGIMKVACMDATDPDMVCPHTSSHMIMNGVKPENTTAFSCNQPDVSMMERTSAILQGMQVHKFRLPQDAHKLGENIDYFICDTCSGREVTQQIVFAMGQCMAPRSVMVVGIFCGGRNTTPETVDEIRLKFTTFMESRLKAKPFPPMQDDMRANSTEARGMIYLPFQFGESSACPMRESDGIRILHDEDPATAVRANYFRKMIEDARAAKVAAKVAAKEKRVLKKQEAVPKDTPAVRSSSRSPKKRSFLEPTMEPASKYMCTEFQLQQQWKRSPYMRGDEVVYMGDVVTLKGYDHASVSYSVQYPGSSSLFEADARQIETLDSPQSTPRAAKKARTSVGPDAMLKMEERMAAMEQDHVLAMTQMEERMAAMEQDHIGTMAQVQELLVALGNQ